ncbi:MAG TPA: hypothetical protein VGI87_10275 [Solirubrobacteraceae bacterium]
MSTTGNDNGGTNDCATQSSPCKTIANALTHATAGDTIQLGPGIFATSVTTAKAVTFAGAGPGTANAPFDPTKDTAIDAIGTQQPGITINNRNVKIEGMRIRGGVFDDMNGGEVLPAVQASGAGNPTLDISDAILLQGSPPSPDVIDYALEVDQVRTTVENSTIVPFQDGISSKGTGGTLTVTHSTVSGPTPDTTGLFLHPVAAVWTLTPAAIVDSQLSGIQGVDDEGTSAGIARTVILASGSGAILTDGSSSVAGSMAIRDSVVDVVGNPTPGSPAAVALTSPVNSDPTPPTLTLVGDTAFVRSSQSPAALLVNAAAGSNVNIHNTILHAIDTSGHNAANDIHAGTNALNWNVSFSDYAEVAGQGVPAAGSGTNLTAPPDFVNDSGANLRLSSTSTLFDKGDPAIVGAGETDVTGAPRSEPHTCGAPARPDLGAFEAAPPPCPITPPAPTIGHFSQSHKKWRTGSQAAALTASKHRKHKRKAPVGTTFSFSLNTPSTVTLTFTGSARGRKGKGGKCVAQTKRNKKKHSCKRTIQAGTLTFANAAAGTDSIAFAGKIPGHKKLKAGTYTVTIEATNSSGHSGTSTLHFTVVKR